jgi:hypothetical protein
MENSAACLQKLGSGSTSGSMHTAHQYVRIAKALSLYLVLPGHFPLVGVCQAGITFLAETVGKSSRTNDKRA